MKKSLNPNEIFLAPGGGPTLAFNGAKVTYKVSGAETGGVWALLEYTLPPQFEGLALHWHKRTHTGFYVLEGEVAIQVQTQDFNAEAGAFVSAPPYTPHTFNNRSTQPARLLEIIMPSGAENYLKEWVALAQLGQGLPPHEQFDFFLVDE